jgi:PAP2 superfamily
VLAIRHLIPLAMGVMLALPHAAWAKHQASTAYDSYVAVAWFRLLYDVVKTESLSAPVAARIYGYAAITLYEAVAPGSPEYRSLAGQLNGLSAVPNPESHPSLHWPSVANTALARIARALIPTASTSSRGRIDTLEADFEREFRIENPRLVVDRSVAHGVTVADTIAAWAASDGIATYANCPFTPPVGTGLWEPTPPAFAASPLQPCWGQLRPFIPSSSSCAPPPHPAYSEIPGSDFYNEGVEVYATVKGLTPEQKIITGYWEDRPGATGTPSGHWIAITGEIVRAERMALTAAAEAFARVGIAVADAFISCWHTKYVYNLLRPVTFIRRVLDLTWSPSVITPPFPEYSSGHSVQSAAAATVLTNMLGVRLFTDTTHVDHGFAPPLAPRSFSSFNDAAKEAAISRLYGGIHYRSAIDLGLRQGACIGQVIIDRIKFKG